MNKKEVSLVIIDNLSHIFEMSDSEKQDIFRKLMSLEEKEIMEIVNSILKYKKKQTESFVDLLKFLKIKQNSLTELKEKKEFSKKSASFFDNL